MQVISEAYHFQVRHVHRVLCKAEAIVSWHPSFDWNDIQ